MRDASTNQAQARNAFIPPEFHDDVDVAECALDEQLEQLHRQYGAASRAVAKAKFEVDLLATRDEVPAHLLAQARRQRAAAETRCARLMRTIDALEERLERVEND